MGSGPTMTLGRLVFRPGVTRAVEDVEEEVARGGDVEVEVVPKDNGEDVRLVELVVVVLGVLKVSEG